MMSLYQKHNMSWMLLDSIKKDSVFQNEIIHYKRKSILNAIPPY